MEAMDSNSCAERVHNIFLGSMEFAKWLRFFSLITEIAAALVAALRIFMPHLEWPGWASFVLALVVVLGVVLSIWANSVAGFAERCRRISIRAYGKGTDVSQAITTSVVADAPILATWLAKRLPSTTLHAYYESEASPGNGRIRELYAHSAFYTWRLRRVCWRIFLALAVVFGAIGFIAIYALAASPSDPSVSGRILDFVCSIVFVFLTTKAAAAACDARKGYLECRRVQELLLEKDAASDLNELVVDYDIAVASGARVPTIIYMEMRDGLQREWHEIRPALNAH